MTTFLNFPISLLKPAFNDMQKVCKDIIEFDNCNMSVTFEGLSKKPVMTGISENMLSDYMENEKTGSEIASLLAFLAIKSILGKKSFCRITSEFLLCRMAGYDSKNEMIEIPEVLKKYQIRWHMDSLKQSLKNNYGLRIYGRYTRGFFVSFKLSEEQLIRQVETKRKKYLEKTQKDEQIKAVKKVLTELYGNQTS
jgi:hypothetical protein